MNPGFRIDRRGRSSVGALARFRTRDLPVGILVPYQPRAHAHLPHVPVVQHQRRREERDVDREEEEHHRRAQDAKRGDRHDFRHRRREKRHHGCETGDADSLGRALRRVRHPVQYVILDVRDQRGLLEGVVEHEHVVGADAEHDEYGEHLYVAQVRDAKRELVYEYRHRQRHENLEHTERRDEHAPGADAHVRPHRQDRRERPRQVVVDDELRIFPSKVRRVPPHIRVFLIWNSQVRGRKETGFDPEALEQRLLYRIEPQFTNLDVLLLLVPAVIGEALERRPDRVFHPSHSVEQSRSIEPAV